MRHFRLRNESGLGATTTEEADIHMLRKQDPCRSSNKQHNNKEKAFGGGLRTRKVSAIHLGKQDHYLH